MTLKSKGKMIGEWTFVSIYEFLNETEWLEAFCKRHPEYNPDDEDDDVLEYIESDEDEIRDILEADHRLWSVKYIQERNYDYFLIRQWEK